MISCAWAEEFRTPLSVHALHPHRRALRWEEVKDGGRVRNERSKRLRAEHLEETVGGAGHDLSLNRIPNPIRDPQCSRMYCGRTVAQGEPNPKATLTAAVCGLTAARGGRIPVPTLTVPVLWTCGSTGRVVRDDHDSTSTCEQIHSFHSKWSR